MTHEELILKAKEAKSAEELLALAKENGMEMTEEEAKAYFAQLNPTSGELSDDELDNVAGGGCHYRDGRLIVTPLNGCDYWRCDKCGEKTTTGHGMIFYDNMIPGSYNHACNQNADPVSAVCSTCKYCTPDGGLLLCENPNKCK